MFFQTIRKGAKHETVKVNDDKGYGLLRSESRVVCFTSGCNPRSLRERSCSISSPHPRSVNLSTILYRVSELVDYHCFREFPCCSRFLSVLPDFFQLLRTVHFCLSSPHFTPNCMLGFISSAFAANKFRRINNTLCEPP
jgi:hypothetical protein